VSKSEPLRSSVPIDVPESDFWEGETWEWLGKSLFFGIPALVLLLVAVGGFAAKTYNEGATCALPASFKCFLV
jgi:hypothetical protein